MALHDSIILEICNGGLSRELRVADLTNEARKVLRTVKGSTQEFYRVGFNFYKKTNLDTELANFAEDTGYWVKAGRAAKYRKVGPGLYRVIALEETEALSEMDTVEPLLAQYSSLPSFEDRFACYLETQAFQVFDRKRKVLYPSTGVVGFPARLDSYFWPKPSLNYGVNAATLQGFIDRAQNMLPKLLDDARQVTDIVPLFTEICNWGKVSLPTTDAQYIVDQLLIAQRGRRTQAAAMNSAWTKLYAIFFPEDFVIYDSRVATALLLIGETVMSDSELEIFKQRYPALGQIAGRGGSRYCARTYWRHAWGKWSAQLDANTLVKRVLAALNQRTQSQYRLRELEAVLFMEGY